jgi:hypothetical protein
MKQVNNRLLEDQQGMFLSNTAIEAQLERNDSILTTLGPSYTKIRGSIIMMAKLLSNAQIEIMNVDDSILQHQRTYQSPEELKQIFGLNEENSEE